MRIGRTGTGDNVSEVVLLSWEEFSAWWQKEWKPGEHIYVAGQTGSGKTTTGVRLVEHRPVVAALDAKGMDGSLSASGWDRIQSWLPRWVKEDLKDHRPVRVIVGGISNNDDQFAKLSALLKRAIKGIWAMGNWVCFCDEGQIISDTRYVGGGTGVERLLIAARDRGVSVVFATQRPSVGLRAPSSIAAMQQASWLVVTRTRDRKVHARLAELAGRPIEEMSKLITGLPRFHWALFSLSPYDPIRIFCPPPLPRLPPQKRSKVSLALWGHSAS